MLAYIASILGFIGITMAWITTQRNKRLTEEVEEVGSRIYHLRREVEASQEKIEQQQMHLKFELLKLKDGLKITPDMKIGEIITIYPQAQQLLAEFHIGGCSSCSVDNQQPLGEAAAMNGRALEPILVALNDMVAGNGSVQQVKKSNIQLHF
ncbi:hypothetical protein QUF64_04935 [Anaerolineales bacterium HSG6]|nr:hypothetical protein [Anaerolineales bacterium HSG6]MDM8531893.1 hypothetical protein [Anaerolineales bacterium HSG25]